MMVYFIISILSLLCFCLIMAYYRVKIALAVALASLEQKERAFEKERALYEQTEEKVKTFFQSISHEALQKNNQAFLDLAKTSFDELKAKNEGIFTKKEEAISHLVTPMKESLNKLDVQLQGLQKEHKVEASLLQQQLKLLLASEEKLRQETASLVQALKTPGLGGRWGEVQLRRIVEMAGMLSHCDFMEQKTYENADVKHRPDMIIHLPSERVIAIDAKAPFDLFLQIGMTEGDGVEKQIKLKEHARQLKNHVMALGKKSYFEHFKNSPEFVVMFLPSESLFTAALSIDPSLIEFAAEKGVIIATPSTLIGLLKAIALGWKQDQFSKNAEMISKLGHELYKRLNDMNKHLSQVGKNINSAAHSYNKAMGSFESRVLVSARRFQELGAATSEIDLDSPEFIETVAREDA